MGPTHDASSADRATRAWAPVLAKLRLVGDGRGAALLSPDANVQWWCAPDFDGPPLCWRLLDEYGGRARFPALEYVDADDVPAAPSATTLLRDQLGVIEVRDAILSVDDGVALVRLLRRRRGLAAAQHGIVEQELRLGGFDTSVVHWEDDGQTATGVLSAADHVTSPRARGPSRGLRRGAADTAGCLEHEWTALVVAVDAQVDADAVRLIADVEARDAVARRALEDGVLPSHHPRRALDALAVIRACTSRASGAVAAAPTTSLPEAPGHDRQFDYRYTWLRDASLSTAVAALLGKGSDARRYLEFVNDAWGDADVVTQPVLDVRGAAVPDERTVDGVSGWGASLPIRLGNGASGQTQYDSLGLFAEAVSVTYRSAASSTVGPGRSWSAWPIRSPTTTPARPRRATASGRCRSRSRWSTATSGGGCCSTA
ncbi:MAG: hypothetical protein KY451_11250 [Actinobacteria bacterium]|nr:hypothetical protein [Actinomycetota bacterium]